MKVFNFLKFIKLTSNKYSSTVIYPLVKLTNVLIMEHNESPFPGQSLIMNYKILTENNFSQRYHLP